MKRSDPAKCIVCGTGAGVRLFGVCIDGEPLRLQVPLCDDHGDQYLIRVGVAIGEFVREAPERGRPS